MASSSSRPRDGAIELRGVSFRYSDVDPLVLQDVNLRIEAGESVAITGPSGCGKTTLAKVILGLLEPSAGEILVGGVSLQRLGASVHRECVGAVMQEDQLFAGSIADNIAFFDPAPDHERIQIVRPARRGAPRKSLQCRWATTRWWAIWARCFRAARSSAFCSPARSTRSRDMLVLDEATSHLDVTRERQVNEAIKQLKLTRIIIAHRPETIASCERVVVLGQSSPQAGGVRQVTAEAA